MKYYYLLISFVALLLNTSCTSLNINKIQKRVNVFESIEGIQLNDSVAKVLYTFKHNVSRKYRKKDRDIFFFKDGRLSFEIDKHTQKVIRINMFGYERSHLTTKNNRTKIHYYNKYDHNFKRFGNLNSCKGISMNTVVKKLGLPNKPSKINPHRVEWYTYVLDHKKIIFHFHTDDIEDYKDKKITFISISTLSEKDKNTPKLGKTKKIAQ